MFLLLYGKFLIPELVDEDEVLYLGNNTIIVQDLDNQILDIGHIDTKYEWFKMDAKYVVSIGKNKHMAESVDKNLNEEDNPQYQKEINALNEESSRYKLSI
ncbi:GT-D fold domain-containing glycosyltransferase [Lactobacillus johnsonii]|uniref:GT-D fold domain-containing glycosyltransferase n=1 Tax=Lactobacillus johnsonii TaxID=33959 RepID=UPI001E40E7E5|nr:GT-D fold domain-containing glycosyltransferase [Lactobacillus johnsonii]